MVGTGRTGRRRRRETNEFGDAVDESDVEVLLLAQSVGEEEGHLVVDPILRVLPVHFLQMPLA